MKRHELLAASFFAIVLTGNASAHCVAPYFKVSTQTGWNLHVAAPALADLNGDHILDLVWGDDSGLEVALGKADGSFEQAVQHTEAGVNVKEVVVTDFDLDGKLDIIARSATTIAIFIGNGDGTFHVTTTRSVLAPGPFVTGDFDGDGKTDIAYMSSQAGSTLFFEFGAGDALDNGGAVHETIGGITAITVAPLYGNGRLQIVTAAPSSTQLTVYDVDAGQLKRGMTTFWVTKTVLSSNTAASQIAVGDFDEDGRLDLAAVSPIDDTISVIRGGAGTTFLPAVYYSTRRLGSALAEPLGIVAADFNGDGHLDLVTSNLVQGDVSLFPGNGDGTFGAPAFSPIDFPFGASFPITAGDVDRDGLRDIVVSGSFDSILTVVRNTCGALTATLSGAPTISLGQNDLLNITATTPLFYMPAATGQFTLREGSTVIGTYDLRTGATLSWSALGDHTFTATYNGDQNYDATDTPPLTVHVTSATTSVVVHVPANLVYSETTVFTATVTSSTGDTPGGTVTYTVDGALAATGLVSFLPAGPHTISGRYNGDAMHPPSDSAPVAFTVAKGTPIVDLSATGGSAGNPSSFYFDNSAYGLGGTVTATLDGVTVLNTTAVPFATVTTSLGVLPGGTHHLRLDYSGDSNYFPIHRGVTFDSVAAGALHVIATAVFNSVTVSWNADQSQTYNIDLYSPQFGWSRIWTTNFSPFSHQGLTPNTAYAYRVRSSTGAVSNIDVAVTMGFTDEPLLGGLTTITVQHFKELENAVNALRTLAGLSAMTFNDGRPVAGGVIRASHVTDLRNALNAALTVLGAPAVTWTDPTLLAHTTRIRAMHVQELRDAVR